MGNQSLLILIWTFHIENGQLSSSSRHQNLNFLFLSFLFQFFPFLLNSLVDFSRDSDGF